MPPEVGQMGTMICVPSPVLPTGRSVQIDDGIYPFRGAKPDYAIQMSESIRPKVSWVHGRFEMSIVDGNPNAVQRK